MRDKEKNISEKRRWKNMDHDAEEDEEGETFIDNISNKKKNFEQGSSKTLFGQRKYRCRAKHIRTVYN
jgi:hypothetical protein